jgi:hypothetical protein
MRAENRAFADAYKAGRYVPPIEFRVMNGHVLAVEGPSGGVGRLGRRGRLAARTGQAARLMQPHHVVVARAVKAHALERDNALARGRRDQIVRRACLAVQVFGRQQEASGDEDEWRFLAVASPVRH